MFQKGIYILVECWLLVWMGFSGCNQTTTHEDYDLAADTLKLQETVRQVTFQLQPNIILTDTIESGTAQWVRTDSTVFPHIDSVIAFNQVRYKLESDSLFRGVSIGGVKGQTYQVFTYQRQNSKTFARVFCIQFVYRESAQRYFDKLKEVNQIVAVLSKPRTDLVVYGNTIVFMQAYFAQQDRREINELTDYFLHHYPGAKSLYKESKK